MPRARRASSSGGSMSLRAATLNAAVQHATPPARAAGDLSPAATTRRSRRTRARTRQREPHGDDHHRVEHAALAGRAALAAHRAHPRRLLRPVVARARVDLVDAVQVAEQLGHDRHPDRQPDEHEQVRAERRRGGVGQPGGGVDEPERDAEPHDDAADAHQQHEEDRRGRPDASHHGAGTRRASPRRARARRRARRSSRARRPRRRGPRARRSACISFVAPSSSSGTRVLGRWATSAFSIAMPASSSAARTAAQRRRAR